MTTTTKQTGTIKAVNADKGYGFIKRDDEPDVFFHMSDLDKSLTFDESLRELRVEFDVIQTEKGFKALRIRKAD